MSKSQTMIKLAAIAALLRSGTKGREEAFNKLKEVMEKYSAKDDER